MSNFTFNYMTTLSLQMRSEALVVSLFYKSNFNKKKSFIVFSNERNENSFLKTSIFLIL
jgi:hypothetical protein